jgi:hypothetical protein
VFFWENSIGSMSCVRTLDLIKTHVIENSTHDLWHSVRRFADSLR